MAPLFSKVDSNKFWHGGQNEETVIYAKFGKDLFNISKVIGRKTKPPPPVFLAYLVHSGSRTLEAPRGNHYAPARGLLVMMMNDDDCQ